MYNGTKVLDVHSHVRPHRAAYLFFNDLVHSRLSLESPIGPGRHSGIPGMRDEDFQSMASSHAATWTSGTSILRSLPPTHCASLAGWSLSSSGAGSAISTI